MRRRLLGPLGVATALTAGLSLFATGALASPSVPSDEDIAAVDAAAADAATAIAALESELATNRDAYDAAVIQAQIAGEAYAGALDALDAAEQEQQQAEQAAADAELELDAASAAMAELAMASYRSGGELAQLGALLSADGLEDALAQATTFQVLGPSTAAAEQRFEDAVVASEAANARAAAAVTDRAAAAEELQQASAAADEAAAAAESILLANEARYGDLIAELAALRQTSVEMEEQRQASREAERIAAENAAAAAALGVEVEQPTAPEQADDPTSAPGQQPSSPAPTTSQPTAAPTTAAPTTPAPTQAPTTQAPTPAPTTSTPSPTPTTTKPPVTTPPTAPPSDNANAAALAWAKTQLGKPYVYGAAGPNSYDCSGLTMMAYKNAGVTISRTSKSQYYSGALVPVGQMKPGDLIFYSSNGSPSGIYHVAIYAGNGMRLHAPSPGKTVELVSMYWTNVLPYAARP